MGPRQPSFVQQERDPGSGGGSTTSRLSDVGARPPSRLSRAPLDRLTALDPTGAIGPTLIRLARRVPGVVSLETRYEQLETAVLRELGSRLDELSNGDRRALPAPELDEPGELMQDLLRRSIDQSPQDSERELAAALLRELVPDEARILAALSDGTAFPLIHIVDRSSGTPLLANASSVGRAAGVILPERVPTYVTHLLGLVLVRTGPEDAKLKDEYEILLTDPAARRALATARRSRVERATVTISELGRMVWETASP